MADSIFDALDRKVNPAGLTGANPSLAASLHLGLNSNPDKEAAVRRRAERAGMPASLVRGNERAGRTADVHGLIAGMDEYPVTRALMADPNNAAVAHDAVDSLTEIEKEGGFFSELGKDILAFGEDIGEDIITSNPVLGAVYDFYEGKISDASDAFEDKIPDAFEQGQLTHRLGYLGHELQGATGENQVNIERRVKELKTQMDDLGVSNDGWLGFLTSASEIIGQMHGTFTQPEAAARVALGGSLGATAGLAGGPLAPITVVAGATAGLTSGVVAHIMTDAFIVESGHAYLDMIESGIDKDTAEALATGVGIINAGLEIAGTAAVVVPIKKAAKALVRRAAGEVVKKETVVTAARNFMVGYGTAVGGETATEVLQEVTLIAAEELGRQWTDADQTIEPVTLEEATQRLEAVAIKTFKGMAVLAVPGSSANYMADRSRARRAENRDQKIEKISAIVNKSPLSARTPEVMAKHVQDALQVEAVDMPVEHFVEMIDALGYTAADLLPNSTLIRIYEEAQQIGGDVRIPIAPLVQNVMIGDKKELFDRFRPHIRWQPGEMTATEALEFQASGLEAELSTNVKEAIEAVDNIEGAIEAGVSRGATEAKVSGEAIEAGVSRDATEAKVSGEAIEAKVSGEAIEAKVSGEAIEAGVSGEAIEAGVSRDATEAKVSGEATEAVEAISPVKTGLSSTLQLAEDSLGLQALFRTADEAGMTAKQYTVYLGKIHRAATQSNNRKEIAQGKREARQVTKAIKAEYAEAVRAITPVVRREPIYAAIYDTREQAISATSIADATGGGSLNATLRDQLQRRGVRITTKADEGMHIDAYADLYDLENGHVMLDAMLNTKAESAVVAERAEVMVRANNPELFSRQAELQENLTALMHDDTQQVLAVEIDALTEDRRAGRVKPALVRQVARRAMEQHTIRDISVSKYLSNARKHGRAAGKAIRANDREAARKAKINQLLNMQFAREAEAKRQVVQKGHKYLSQFTKAKRKWQSLAPGYIDAIRGIIDQFSLSPNLSSSKREQLESFVSKAQEDGANFEFPSRLLDDKKRNYKDFTIHDFELVLQKVREMHSAGIKVQANAQQERRTKTTIRVDALVEALEGQPRDEQTLETRGRKKSISRGFEEGKLLLLNTDSILKNLDNFQNLGPTYQAVKESVDQSVLYGYGSQSNIGLNNRKKQIAEKMLELYKVFTKGELNTVSKANIQVPGFAKPISRNTQLSILLNAGNEQNRQALYDSGQVTEEQLNNLIENASERDMAFVQSVWKYLDSFWPEITEGTERRRGFTPEKVQVTPIETEHGTYEGGYYPLRYDSNKGINDATAESVEEAIAQARYGRAIAGHTRHDHTEQRVGSQGRPVLLDLFVVNSHLDQVAYDLELGDAINETYSVLHDPRTKKAFRDAGQVNTWRSLDLWLGDVVTGEMHSGGVVEKSLRWLRAGFTISKLGWNVGVALIQPLGIIQTSVHLGHGHTLRGLKHMLSMPLYGKNNVFQYVNEQSQAMAQREETFHKDIADASQLISDSWVKRYAPEGSVEFVANSLFYGIKKMQRFVDTWTWIAAKEAGLREFENDEAKAIQFADRTVIRTQASGDFQERTPFERGSVSAKARQTELIRTFTALISYFMAKTNVTYERTKKTNFRNPGQVVSWATDMALLYVVEAALVGLIRGHWPDFDEEEDYTLALTKYLAGEATSTAIAGVPMIREFVSEAGGFRGGGVFSSVIGDFGKVAEQVSQGEIDKSLITSANNLGGILFKYPAGQLGKTGRAIALAAEGEDVGALEFIMGPKFNKYR